MHRVIKTILSAVALAGALITPSLAQEPYKISIAAMENGTLFWELEAMKALGLDKANNVELDVRGVADAKAGQIALQAGEVDLILSDFVYVSIQRNSGNMLTFVPHSLAVGGLIVDPAANITKVDDLKGKTLAISGSPVDKSWVILQAYYGQVTGGQLADDATVRFGAPPLINELITGGQAQASLNLWNWNARHRRIADDGRSGACQARGQDRADVGLGYAQGARRRRTAPAPRLGLHRRDGRGQD